MFYLVLSVIVLLLLLWLVDTMGPDDVKAKRIIQIIIILFFALVLFSYHGRLF